MKFDQLFLENESLCSLSSLECETTIGGGWYDVVEFVASGVGMVIGGTAAVLVGSFQYGLNHPAGINQGMENVH